MTSAIDTLPDYSDFGKAFNYAVWSPNTQITFCNVPWSSDYRDIVRFDSDSALDSYLASRSGPSGVIGGLTYCAQGSPIRVDVPFNDCNMYNYLRVHNPAQPVGEKNPATFYYFINQINYIAPNTTEIIVQLDVWSTYGRRVNFGRCYIERGHIGIANENNFDHYGRDYLTIPEGFDLGNEYNIVNVGKAVVADTDGVVMDTNYSVLVVSNTDLTADGGTVDNPSLTVASGSDFEMMPNGSSQYIFDSLADFQNMLTVLKLKPWVTQGIVSVTIIPGSLISKNQNVKHATVGNSNVPVSVPRAGKATSKAYSTLNNFRNTILPSRYSNLKKFLTSPYTIIEMTSFTATPLVLKPECIQSNDVKITALAHIGQPSPRIAFYPTDYNKGSDVTSKEDIAGEYLDFATYVSNFPTFSLPNNGAISYLASNKNSIAYQRQSADWSQQRSLTAANLSANQATNSINTNSAMNEAGIGASNAQNSLANTVAGQRALQSGLNAGVNGIAQMAGGNYAGGLTSGIMGMANAGLDYTITTNQNNQSTAINNNLANQQTGISNANSAYIRDTNLDYAKYAANGDYANAIAGINAKVQDANMIQPTSSGQIGGEAFNLISSGWGAFLRVKTLQPAPMRAVGEFWLRYGYMVNQFAQMPSDFQVMTNFTYWKLRETYIYSQSCPELFKQTIRGIFEKGVTVWRDANKIGQIDIANNAPKAGITL